MEPMKLRHAVLAALLAACAAHAADSCESLASLSLPQVTMQAKFEPAGSLKYPDGKPVKGIPDFCHVAGSIKPSSDSDIQFEVWMPAPEKWNGRFKGIGNGGFAGAIDYPQLGLAVAAGYAAAATDTGHKASGTDASWALDHPEKIIDFGYRAIHLTAVNAKSILKAYYGKPARYSYFESCSNGGRQALMEAQRYPEDYDGIMAGAPANNWTHLLANAAANVQALSGKGSYIPKAKLAAIEAAGLAACDAADGSKDGLISDPTRCRFNPGKLLCKGAETDACLTAPQVKALKVLYTGARASGGAQIFPGYPPGCEAQAGAWPIWITGTDLEHSLMYIFSTQFFKNMVFNDPNWNIRNFNLDRDLKIADRKMASILNATDPDLSRFKARGGKLILYHGWCDAAIAAGSSIEYYNSVKAKLGAEAAGSFMRLVMVPGMLHCGGRGNPAGRLAQELVRWVEDGVAPEESVPGAR